ncbi:hypothetical protein JCGZ_14995 [Jatropha curcas]|uniref:Uncharacterized protein n=1 Tax=Jatropha curcas TaxID=180498 RepID=A0A067K6P8_JATCU|nr:hypothetical protein JCGZ_14995 [Jatropha curcas]
MEEEPELQEVEWVEEEQRKGEQWVVVEQPQKRWVSYACIGHVLGHAQGVLAAIPCHVLARACCGARSGRASL